MKGSNPFRWGIVGTGGIARQFVDDLSLAADAVPVAVCSRSQASAEQFVGHGDQRIYTDLGALLNDTQVDAVYLATPNHMHAGQALMAIDAGKPVLVEKPLATRSSDATRVFEAAKSRKVLAMEAMWSRFLPAVTEAKRLIDAGSIGVPRRIEAELAYARDVARDARFFDRTVGGGAALDLGVYPLSLAMFLFGEPGSASGRWFEGAGGVDLRSEFELDFGGIQARLSCGIDRDGANAMTIFGSQGALRIHPPFLKAQRLSLYRGSAARMLFFGASAPSSGLAGKFLSRAPFPGRTNRTFQFPGNGLQFEAEAMAEAVRRGDLTSAISPPSHTVAVLKAIEAVLSQPPAK